MCYNSESSISNYIYVTIVTLILYLYGDKYDKHFSLSALVAVQMQLAEYFMWKDQKCGIMNKLATLAATFLLFLQPLSIVLGGYLFKTVNMDTSNYILPFLIFYVLTYFISFLNYSFKNKNICSGNKNGHLQWNFLNNGESLNILDYYTTLFYFSVFFFYWLLLKNENLGIFNSVLIIFTFLFHYIRYPENYATMWCYYVSVAITIYITARLLDYKYGIF